MLVTELTDDTQLFDLQPEWEDLVRRSRTASIFQTWEWISVYWQYFSAGKRLVLLCVRDGNRLVGIAPLKITSIHGLPLRRVRLLGSRASDYLNFILDEESESAVVGAVFSWLRQNEDRWDVIDLEKLPENSPILKHWPEARERFGWRYRVSEYGRCPYLLLPDSQQEMRALMGKKLRTTLDYKERLTRRNFSMEIGLLNGSEIDEGLEALVRLHTRRWQERGLPGGLSTERNQEFLRDISRLLAKHDRLRLYGLRLDGRLQSVHLCMVYGNTQYGYIGGWEPSLPRYGLGSVLTGHVINHAIEQGLREFDFLCGDESYKSGWAQTSHANFRLIASKNNARSRLAAAVSRAEQNLGVRTKLILLQYLTALKTRPRCCR